MNRNSDEFEALRQKAVLFCEQNKGVLFLYDNGLESKTGSVEIVENCNCCGPDQSHLFAFETEKRRYVMEADKLLEIIPQLKRL